jgi:ATP-binding cassette subfamily B protein
VTLLGVIIFVNLSLQLVIPQIIGRFIDAVTQGSALTNLVRLGIAFLTTALLQQLIDILASYYTQTVAWTATNTLREDLARHAIHLDMSFHKAHPPGEMISRIDSDVHTLTDFFSQFLLRLVGNVLLIVAVLVLLYLEDWRIGLVLTAFTLLALFVLTRFRNIAVPHWEAERKAEADFYSFLEERLGGTADIRANGGRPYTMREFFKRIRTMYQRSIKAGMMVNFMLNAMLLIFALGNAVSLGVGGSLYLNGVITIGTVYIVYQYNRLLEQPLEDISRQLSNVQKALASIKRILKIFNVQSKITLPSIPQSDIFPTENKPLAVQFDHVSFFYEDSPPEKSADQHTLPNNGNTLEDIHFSLKSGEVLGLLGRTGSGKTTLTRLLFRLYDPQLGAVKLGLDGQTQDLVDIRQIALPLLRNKISMVTQNIELFHASVRDNLSFFDTTIQDKRILTVIRDLGLSRWFAGLEKGLDTILESEGAGLSAGEAQLLAFARIFLRNPSVVVLDEASSRLDPATEHLIEKAVDHLTKGRTALIIAHRLKTVQRADKIMILEKGRIIEFGDRETLAHDQNSRFHHLLQTGLDEVLA